MSPTKQCAAVGAGNCAHEKPALGPLGRSVLRPRPVLGERRLGVASFAEYEKHRQSRSVTETRAQALAFLSSSVTVDGLARTLAISIRPAVRFDVSMRALRWHSSMPPIQGYPMCSYRHNTQESSRPSNKGEAYMDMSAGKPHIHRCLWLTCCNTLSAWGDELTNGIGYRMGIGD